MRYLLVGNGPSENIAAAAAKADVIVQMNTCAYDSLLPPGKTRYIFLTNSGDEVPKLVDQFHSSRTHHTAAAIVLPRNPVFYTAKKWLMRLRGNWHWRDYTISSSWKKLRRLWQVEFISCAANMRLERELRALGMPRSFMPSTGMIAYDWLRHRLGPEDSLAIEGFTFRGWSKHPWDVERQIVKPIRTDTGADAYATAGQRLDEIITQIDPQKATDGSAAGARQATQ